MFPPKWSLNFSFRTRIIIFVSFATSLTGARDSAAWAFLHHRNRAGYQCQRYSSSCGELWLQLDSENDSVDPLPEEKNGARGKTCSLCFSARTTFVSDPLPLPTGGVVALTDFFRSSQHRNHLLMGHGVVNNVDGGKGLPSVETLISPTPDLWERWLAEAARAGALPPCPSSDELLRVQSSGIPFPLGMTIFADSIVGSKVLLPEGAGGADYISYPEYQFTLVRETVRAEGPRPLVWVHDVITGAGKEKKRQSTHSFSSLCISESNEILEHVVFTSDSSIEISIKFPSVLLRLLPMSKKKCNELGSASIQHAFQDRGAPSLDNFVRAYKTWLAVSNQ